MKPKKDRIAVIGCRGLDPMDIFSLANNNWLDELILIGEENEQVEKVTKGLLNKWAAKQHAAVICGTFQNASNADIAILNSFSKPRTGECESERLNRIARKVRSDVRSLVESRFTGVLIVLPPPVDVMTFVALQAGKFEAGRVIGLPSSGGPHIGPASNSASLWCSGKQDHTSFLDHCDPNCAHFTQVVHLTEMRDKAELHFTGNRFAGMALCVTRICEAVIKDENELLPASAFLNGEYGVSGIFMTVPCLVGRDGVERIVKLPVSSEERFRMFDQAAQIRASMERITNRRAATASIL